MNYVRRSGDYHFMQANIASLSLREKCPNTEFILVRIFPHSDWIRTRKNSVFGHFSRSVCYVQCISNDLQVLIILLYHLYNSGTYLKIKFRIQSLSKSVFIWIDALSANYFI